MIDGTVAAVPATRLSEAIRRKREIPRPSRLPRTRRTNARRTIKHRTREPGRTIKRSGGGTRELRGPIGIRLLRHQPRRATRSFGTLNWPLIPTRRAKLRRTAFTALRKWAQKSPAPFGAGLE